MRWQPGKPDNVKLKGKSGVAEITWSASGDESHLSYYEVDLHPRPETAGLPRHFPASSKSSYEPYKVTVKNIPSGDYSASVRAVRHEHHGAVSSEAARTAKIEISSSDGLYPRSARILLAIFGAISIVVACLFLAGIIKPGTGVGSNFSGWALLAASLMTLGLVLLLGLVVRYEVLLSGADDRISTSQVNVALWTVAIAFGIFTLVAVAYGAHAYAIANPCHLNHLHGKVKAICIGGRAVVANKLSFSHTFKSGLAPNYLVLLGAPFATLAGSAFIVNQQVGKNARQKVSEFGPNKFSYAFSNDDGDADLVDSQYLVFTGVLLFYFLTNFLPNPTSLPALPWGLVGLTGVSAGTYLLNKSVTANGLTVQGLTSNSVPEGGSARITGRNFLPEGSQGRVHGGLSVMLGGATARITHVSNTSVTFVTDVDKGTYDVKLTTAADVSASAGSLKVT